MSPSTANRPRTRRPSPFDHVDLLEPRQLLAQVTVAPVVAYESSGAALFTATLSSASATATTVTYATVDGTARAGRDYVSQSGSIVIPAGVTSATFSIPLVDDHVSYQPNRRFSVRLGVDGANTASRRAKATIVDDAPPPVVFSSDRMIAVISGGRLRENMPVDLTYPSTRPVRVSYSTSDGTAIAGVDYKAARGTVLFRPGTTEAVIPLTIYNQIDGEDEFFNIRLESASGASLSTLGGPTRFVIWDARAIRPTLTVSDAITDDGEPATFAVTLSSASPYDVSVRYFTIADTASPPQYTEADGVLTIPAGRTTGVITVPTNADGGLSGSARFILQLDTLSYANATYNSSTVVGTINY